MTTAPSRSCPHRASTQCRSLGTTRPFRGGCNFRPTLLPLTSVTASERRTPTTDLDASAAWVTAVGWPVAWARLANELERNGFDVGIVAAIRSRATRHGVL